MANIQSAEIETPSKVETNMATVNPINASGQVDYEKMQAWNNATREVEQMQPAQQATNNVANQTQNVTQQPQTTQQVVTPVETIKPSVAIQIPSDLNDNTVQGYINAYNQGVQINDYQAQINALTAIDNYRTSQGYSPIYTNNIYDLTNQRVDKIKGIISEYEADMQEAVNMGDYELSQQIGNQLEAYKKSVNYKDTINNASTYLENVEYKSTWDSAINGIVNQLLTAQFTYNPNNDQALLMAQKYATNTVYESMNAKGILDSTMTAQIVTKTVNELIPVYQKMAKQEFNENIERLRTVANLLMTLDNTEYARWQDSVAYNLERYEAKKDEVTYQWNRVNQMGYVDNEASIILGVPVGTMSPSIRESIMKAEQEATAEYNKLYTDLQLAQAKAELELQTYEAKKQIDSAYNNEVSVYAQKKAIDAMYKSGTNGGTTGEYSGMTNTEMRDTIKAKYQNDEITDVEAIKEIYSNFESSKIPSMLNNILDGMTKKQADDLLYEDEIANSMNVLRDTYGTLTKNNKIYYENEIVNAVDNGLPEDYANKLLEEIEKELDYETRLKSYLKNENDILDFVTNFESDSALKKAMKKKELPSQLKYVEEQEENLIEQLGRERYSKIVEQITEKEEEIRAILKNKGIDW